jgi:hypothetical protein
MISSIPFRPQARPIEPPSQEVGEHDATDSSVTLTARLEYERQVTILRNETLRLETRKIEAEIELAKLKQGGQ